MNFKISRWLQSAALLVVLLLAACGGGGSGTEGGTAASLATPALVVSGRTLKDSAGNTVLLRGVNVPVYQSGYVDDLTAVAAAVKSSGANAVRLVWWGDVTNGWAGGVGAPTLLTLANLDRAITEYSSLGILPIVELHDATRYLAVGMGTSATWNDQAIFKTRITDFWTRADVVALVKKHEKHMAVNLANEWGAVASDYSDAPAFVQNYVTAIGSIRTAWAAASVGAVPLIVDSPNGGSSPEVFLATNAAQPAKSNGRVILDADPLANTLFSAHAYWPATAGYSAASITALLQNIAASGLPVVLGEIGTDANGSACGVDTVDWSTVLTTANTQDIGTVVWTWYQDGTCNDMNLVVDGVTVPAFDGSGTFRDQVLHNATWGLQTSVLIPLQ